MGQNFDLLGIPKTHKRLGIDSSSGTDSSSGADSSSGTDSSSGSNSGNSNSNSFIVYIIPIPIPGKNGIKTPLVEGVGAGGGARLEGGPDRRVIGSHDV